MKVEVAVLGFPSQTVLVVSVDVKQHLCEELDSWEPREVGLSRSELEKSFASGCSPQLILWTLSL